MDIVNGLPLNVALLFASAAIVVLSLVVLIFRRSSDAGSKVTARRPVPTQAAADVPADPSKPTVRILYGTQTGTAERFSKQLCNELRKKYGDSTVVDVVDIENYKATERLPSEKLVVLFMATYGDGEPTDNAADFFAWLTKETQAVEAGEKDAYLQRVSYAVFGLGNKQYEHFNAVGKKVYKALSTLGATPVVRRGDGDDDGCIDDDFDKWLAELHQALEKSDLVGNKAEQTPAEAVSINVAAYEVEIVPTNGHVASTLPFAVGGSGKDAHSPYLANVAMVKELHGSQSDRSCIHAEIDIAGSQVAYEHGDHVAIFPQNSPAIVEEVSCMLGYPLDTVFKLSVPAKTAGGNAPLPEPFVMGPVSLQTALACFADVLSVCHKEALAALSTFASNPEEAQRLRRMASAEGKQEFVDFIAKPHRSLLEVMRSFPSAKPSLGAFFGCIAPRLQPRFYSISSSPKQHPARIHVTAAVVKEIVPTGRVHEGVCSTWLARHAAGRPVPIFVRRSHFKLPSNLSVPIIMVGPGTGLAPFRGFLQERAALAASGASLGHAVLFFGCRNRQHDYIYEQELQGYVASRVLSVLHVAFSREGVNKDYVQHHMEREAAAVWQMVSEQGAYIYVCGDAKHMAKDVHKALITIVQSFKKCTGTQAEAYIKELADSGRYQRDVW